MSGLKYVHHHPAGTSSLAGSNFGLQEAGSRKEEGKEIKSPRQSASFGAVLVYLIEFDFI